MGYYNFFNNEQGFNYSILSEHMISALYKIRKNKKLTKIDKEHLEQGKKILQDIIDGNSLHNNHNDIASLTNNSLFIYDYGFSAIDRIESLNADKKTIETLKVLLSIAEDIENKKGEEIEILETFFETIGKLIDDDIIRSKYRLKDDSIDLFSTRYL